MSENQDWQARLLLAASKRVAPTLAQTFVTCWWYTSAKPALLNCDDAWPYVVKGAQVGRAIVNEHVVGLLGRLLGAPVPRVRLVNVGSELIKSEPDLAHFTPGICHGSEFIPECFDDTAVRLDEPGNRGRFASLAALFALIEVHDLQLIYKKQVPRLVTSIDHGHFFPGRDGWTPETLAKADPVHFDHRFSELSFRKADLELPGLVLSALTYDNIAGIVASPPEAWGISFVDREALCEYLWRRIPNVLHLIHRLAE